MTCLLCAVAQFPVAMAVKQESHQGGQVFELSGREGINGGLSSIIDQLGEGTGQTAEETVAGKGKVRFDYDVQQAAEQDVMDQKRNAAAGREPRYIRRESFKSMAKHSTDKDFSDKQLNVLQRTFATRADDVGATGSGVENAMGVESDAAQFVDPQMVANYQTHAATQAAIVGVEAMMDSTYRHNKEDDGDLKREWALPDQDSSTLTERQRQTQQIEEGKLNSALKKAIGIRRPAPKLMHSKSDYRNQLKREVDMLRAGHIHPLLKLRHRFMMKEMPTLDETKAKEAMKQAIEESLREEPEKQLQLDIQEEIKDVSDEIKNTKKEDQPYHLKKLDTEKGPKCVKNKETSAFVAAQLKSLADGKRPVVLQSCDDVAEAGLCRSKRLVTALEKSPPLPTNQNNTNTTNQTGTGEANAMRRSSKGTEVNHTAEPLQPDSRKTFPMRHFMALWCEMSCKFGPCLDETDETLRTYAAKVAESKQGKNIAEDQAIATSDFDAQNVIFQIEKDRVARQANANAEERQAKSVKKALDRQAAAAKESKIKDGIVKNKNKSGLGKGDYDLASAQAAKLVDHVTSLRFSQPRSTEIEPGAPITPEKETNTALAKPPMSIHEMVHIPAKEHLAVTLTPVAKPGK